MYEAGSKRKSVCEISGSSEETHDGNKLERNARIELCK